MAATFHLPEQTANQQESPRAIMSDKEKVHILVVDDLPEKLLVLDSVLGELGQTIITASSGEEALRKVLEYDFAVILLDVNMPGMDGFETAAFIRKRKKSAHTPIIFITAFSDEMHTAQGYLLGAVDYILSPVVPEILRTKVQVFVDLFRMAQQVKRQADERVALAQEQAARAAAEDATRRSSFLAEAGTLLSSSLNFEATVGTLARLVVPFLADLGAVILAGDHGRTGAFELAWDDTGGEIRTHSGSSRETIHGPLAVAVQHALTSGKARMLSHQDCWPASDAGPNPPRFPLNSVVILPLVARGRTLGILLLARGPLGRAYGPADLALADDLAGRAAVALDNARLYQNIQEGDRRKNEFLAMLAHELRNPLAPIRNAVQVLRLIGLKEPNVIQARDMIDRQVTHMARLIDDLLDMSRLSRGKILLKKERADLVQVVRATVEDYRSLLEGNNLKVNATLPDQPLFAHCDPVRLAQVVGNILHNANKFTDAGGAVTVEVRQADPGGVAIVVRDSGIGMDAEMLQRAFETFSQADSSLERSRGGLGLGLSLVKGLVALHGGTVHATSGGIGKGTEVTIRVPLDPEPAPEEIESTPLATEAGAPRILVIEDSPDTAESMRMLLSLSGYPVEIALSGADGIDAARRFCPQVILCDIGLPGGMDGYAVARELRADPTFNGLFLVALTGYGQEEDRRRSHEAGFDAHLTKPMDFAELQRLLAELPAGS
jgi:signal transduction histidine kinase/DNA-binding response OmpR family regulator